MTTSTERDDLRSMVRSLLQRAADETSVRRHMAGDGFDRQLWSTMADLGLLSLAIPEASGGSGAGWVEQGIVFEELGRTLACGPYLATVALAAAALLASDAPQAREWLSRVSSGDLTATLSAPSASGAGWYGTDCSVAARAAGSGWLLDGRAEYVLDGSTSELVLVSARSEGNDIAVFAVESVAAIESVSTSDQTRRVAHLTFAATPATRVGGVEVLRAAHATGVAMLACEQLGGATACLEQATEYAGTRHQFGRPIGSFQAVQHHCANMLVAVESARSAAECAAAARDLPADEDPVSPWVAGSACGEGYAQCASTNLQVHGGIGYTWEHSAQLHVKRSRGSLVLLGTPAQHRRALRQAGHVLVTR